MADYWVNDDGDGSAGTSWATAYQSIAALVAAVPTALTTSGNRIFIGYDHNDSVTGAARTYTGPSSGLPVLLISCDTASGTNPPAYRAGTGDQLKTSDGAYNMILDGAFALYGVRIESGAALNITGDVDEAVYLEGATLAGALNISVSVTATSAKVIAKNLVVDLTADGTTNRNVGVLSSANSTDGEICGLSFINPAYRTGTVLNWSPQNGQLNLSSADFSGFTNATLCEIVGSGHGYVISNCLTAATWAPANGTVQIGSQWAFYNVGPADAPTYLYIASGQGTIASSTSIYRTGGATVEGEACSWLITTTALCAEEFSLLTPWIYGLVSSTGSKTFDVYITNDTADFTDAEVWLEVEYLATADEAQWTLAKDQRATITTTAAAQTDDTTSTWNGTGPSYTYKQKLSVTATVNETGQYRARVCVGVASIASSRYFYVDPKVTVT